MALSTFQLTEEIAEFRNDPIIRAVLSQPNAVTRENIGSELSIVKKSRCSTPSEFLSSTGTSWTNVVSQHPHMYPSTVPQKWLYENTDLRRKDDADGDNESPRNPADSSALARYISESVSSAQLMPNSDRVKIISAELPNSKKTRVDYATGTRRFDILASGDAYTFPRPFSTIPDMSFYPHTDTAQQINGAIAEQKKPMCGVFLANGLYDDTRTTSENDVPLLPFSGLKADESLARQFATERANWSIEREFLLHKIEGLEQQLAEFVRKGSRSGCVEKPYSLPDLDRNGYQFGTDGHQTDDPDKLVRMSVVMKMQKASAQVMERLATDSNDIISTAVKSLLLRENESHVNQSGIANRNAAVEGHVDQLVNDSLYSSSVQSSGFQQLHSRALRLVDEALSINKVDSC